MTPEYFAVGLGAFFGVRPCHSAYWAKESLHVTLRQVHANTMQPLPTIDEWPDGESAKIGINGGVELMDGG